MAVRDDIRDPAAAKKWEARIAELPSDLIKFADYWAELLLALAKAKREIGERKAPGETRG